MHALGMMIRLQYSYCAAGPLCDVPSCRSELQVISSEDERLRAQLQKALTENTEVRDVRLQVSRIWFKHLHGAPDLIDIFQSPQ